MTNPQKHRSEVAGFGQIKISLSQPEGESTKQERADYYEKIAKSQPSDINSRFFRRLRERQDENSN